MTNLKSTRTVSSSGRVVNSYNGKRLVSLSTRQTCAARRFFFNSLKTEMKFVWFSGVHLKNISLPQSANKYLVILT